MTARIFCPAASATQSAPGVKQPWMLRYEPESPRAADPLMGWTSSSDMKSQIKLRAVPWSISLISMAYMVGAAGFEPAT